MEITKVDLLTNKTKMKKRQNFLMLAAAALLASCSQDDALQSTVNTNEGLKPMTITASLPTDGMQTRAAGDAAVTRCYVQVLDADGNLLGGDNSNVKPMTSATDGGFITTMYLKEGVQYDFLFWADTEDTQAAAPTNLKEVTYNTEGKTIAWAGRIDNKAWDEKGVETTLQHIVTRVNVVNRDNALTVSDAWPLTITLDNTYNAYNVETGEATGIAVGYAFRAVNGSYDPNEEVGYFYVLGNKQNQKLALSYAGPLGNNPIYIENFPVLPNYHITLSGDIKNSGLVEGAVNATVEDEWGKDWSVQFIND